ncbi:MAG TPA: invasion associated locus B family protein [Rhizomicrobium sp.]|nr:invasion associated locus B family protein [Rhizomicrobium sp.]
MNDQTRTWLTRGGIALGVFVLGAIVGWLLHSSGPGVQRVAFYKDWRLACPSDEDKKASCALATDVADQKSGTRLAQVTIGADAANKDKRVMVVTVPLTVLIAPGLGVQFGADTQTVAYVTCLPSGCVATVPVTDKLLGQLNDAGAMNLVVTAESGRAITLPVSVQGYKDAAAALNATEGKRNSWWKRLWS